jgi:Kef-type K+ transport system membrane component KefB
MHESNAVLLELLLIFASAKLLAEVFERLRLPGVLGELAAGILLGPFALGWIHPGHITEALAELGAIFLLFHVGLETSPQDLLRVGKQALAVAILGVAAPFILGFGYMWLRGDQIHEAVFVGAALVATSVGITARVLGDMDALRSRVARIILGAAVFDDILGMVLLAIVSGMAAGGGIRWLNLGILLAEAIGFALFMIFFGPRIVRRVRPGLEKMSTRHAPLALSLVLCLLLSWASTKIGMAAIIGSFFAGLVLADYSPEWNLEPRIGAITEFLAPVFFFAIGARLDVRLFHGDVLVAAVIVTILAAISKIFACGLPVLREGWTTAFSVGVGMLPRGEVALIVALVGLQAGIVTDSTYAIVIFMTAVTTVLAPPVLRMLMKRSPEASAEA